MFVQSAEDLKVDPAAKTLLLVNVNQQTRYFSDRPLCKIRVHSHLGSRLHEHTTPENRPVIGCAIGRRARI